ncbi:MULTISPECIES: ParA family protein [Methylobacterium]|uniref:ParA family protein n=1 Tax=Methylobacterium TaxID=407 RepID=UPI0013EB426B|nr:ParA family protein [Methylobacterium sp. DB0501]NGM36165.1 ParA family protein [Methylobacterium sp. DB0501]
MAASNDLKALPFTLTSAGARFPGPYLDREPDSMFVVSVVQQKGGVGKTTLAVNLSGELRQRKMKVSLIDADPQASASAWSLPRKLGFHVRAELITSGTVSQWLRNVLKQQADVTIVDTPAGLGPVFRAAIDVADIVLVPCGPSSLDLNSVRNTLTAITDHLKNDNRNHPRVVLVPTRVERETPEGQQIGEELGALGETVSPALSHDAYYVRAFTQGVTVTTAAPASNAASEIRAVADFLLGQIART